MTNRYKHPGVYLKEIILQHNLTQRELANKIDIATSLLNSIINGSRNINVPIALALEAAGFGNANTWLNRQIDYSLAKAKKDDELKRKNDSIKLLNVLEKDEWVPLNYIRKHIDLGDNPVEEIATLCDLYGADKAESLQKRISSYSMDYFRKSSKFKEIRNNVVAWTVVAEYLVRDQEVPKFNSSNCEDLLADLKKCFYQNKNTIEKAKALLIRNGIKFEILDDRAAATPVEGKSFISGENPAIVLSLKYKRLDNFAFTLLHELGHVFLHLTKFKYKNANFYVSHSKYKVEEFEADEFAKENLISMHDWDNFIYENFEFTDEVILDFSERKKIHPGIIRGRVCHEFKEYYRRRTKINAMNKLS